MERQHKVYYTIKMEKGDLLTVLVLAEPLARVASKFEGYENTRELHQDMRDRFGDVEILSPTEFEEELTKRQLHTPEVLALLISNEVMGELLGLDLTCSIVYGSPNRPMDSIWARIPKAVYMQVDKHATGYHTYIAVPEELSQEVVSRYELKFVSRPVHESELVVLEKCQAVEVIRVGWKTKGMSDKYYFYYHPECYRGSNFPNQQVERRTIQVVTNKNQCCACWQTLAAIDPPHFEGVGEKIFSFQVSVTRCMICRDANWFLLKLQEELGELTQAFMAYHGMTRNRGKSHQELKHSLPMEIADVIAHALLLAYAHEVDVDQALDEKWLVYVQPSAKARETQ